MFFRVYVPLIVTGLAVGTMVGATETPGITATVVGAVVATITGLVAIANNFGDMSKEVREARAELAAQGQAQMACFAVVLAVSSLTSAALLRGDEPLSRVFLPLTSGQSAQTVCDQPTADEMKTALAAQAPETDDEFVKLLAEFVAQNERGSIKLDDDTLFKAMKLICRTGTELAK